MNMADNTLLSAASITSETRPRAQITTMAACSRVNGSASSRAPMRAPSTAVWDREVSCIDGTQPGRKRKCYRLLLLVSTLGSNPPVCIGGSSPEKRIE